MFQEYMFMIEEYHLLDPDNGDIYGLSNGLFLKPEAPQDFSLDI